MVRTHIYTVLRFTVYTTRCVSRGKIRGAIYLDIGAGPEGTTGQEANKEERIHFDSREDWTR